MRRRFFPDPMQADPTGLVAVTETMTPEMLYEAYGRGIFPWSEDPVRWYSPDPRAVFLPQLVNMPKKIAKMMRKGGFRVTFDTAFRQVVLSCSRAHADEGVWIGPTFIDTYAQLFDQGHAHSVEVWQGDTLAGGAYGVQLGGMFAGESMFYEISNASKVAFAYLVYHLYSTGVLLIDAQVINRHTAELGAIQMRRSDFLILLGQALLIHPKYEAQRWPAEPAFEPPTAVPEKALSRTPRFA